MPRYGFLETSSLIKDKRKDKAQRASRNPKRHIPLVSLLLWHKNGGRALLCLASSLANVVGK